MTEDEGGLRVPPSFYEPLPPAKPKSYTRWLVALAAFTTLCTVLGVAGTGIVVVGMMRERRAEERREAATDEAVDAVLARPADGTPGPDGRVRWTSAGPSPSSHVYRVTLPKGWEARQAGIAQTEVVWLDAVFTRLGARGSVFVNRLTSDVSFGDPAFAEGLRRGLEADGGRVISPYTATTFGDGERAYYYDLDTRDDLGDPYRMRVLVLAHGGEKFRVDFAAAPVEWDRLLKELDAMLKTWRWGA